MLHKIILSTALPHCITETLKKHEGGRQSGAHLRHLWAKAGQFSKTKLSIQPDRAERSAVKQGFFQKKSGTVT